MSHEFLEVQVTDEVARITLNRPPLNVLHIPMMRELSSVLDELAQDTAIKVAVITGKGRAFCAGVDVADHTADRVEEMLHVFHAVIRQVIEWPAPVIAAVNGAALGGGWELAMACDIVLAAEGTKIGQPEIKLAVFPPVAAALMPRLVGRQRAMELVLTGRTLTAEEGYQMGLVNHVYPADTFAEQVEAFVQQLTALSAPVVRLTKRVVLQGLDQPFDRALEEAERTYLQDLMQLEDPHEGLAAFMEKRQPVWKNK